MLVKDNKNIDFGYKIVKKKFVKILWFVILLGLIVDPFIFSGRYSGVIWNPNMLSSFSCIAFAALFLNQKKK